MAGYIWAGPAMFCPFCRNPDSRVIDSRTSDDGLAIRRRRQCPQCNGRVSTTETASLLVIKRSGVIEAFSRDKVVSGVKKACQGRPVTEADLMKLAQRGEETVPQSPAFDSPASTRRLTRCRISKPLSGSCAPKIDPKTDPIRSSGSERLRVVLPDRAASLGSRNSPSPGSACHPYD